MSNLARQIQSESSRVMRLDASDIRDSAIRFRQQADTREAEARRLEATLPIMMNETRTREVTRSGRDSDGNRYEFTDTETYTVRVIDQAATTALQNQVTRMRREVQQLRNAAAEIAREADSLEVAAIWANDMYRRSLELAQRTDDARAYELDAKAQEIAEFTRVIKDLKDSFSETFYSSPEKLANLKNAATFMRIDVGTAAMMAGMSIVCAFGGDPINMATGNFVYSKDDLTILGRFPLTFKRFYNAIGGAATNLGQNWTHNFNIRLNKEDEAIHIFFDDGHVETYQKAAEGRYIAARECKNVLIQNAADQADEGVATNGWILVSPAMESFHFDADGLLTKISDSNGNNTDFTYKDNLLAKVETKSGYLTFAYDEHLSDSVSSQSLHSTSETASDHSASPTEQSPLTTPNQQSQSTTNQPSHVTPTHTPLLTSISDHTGRKSTFTYTNNTLTKATHPTGAEHLYIYDNMGRLSELVNPRGITTVKSEYDNENRVVKQYLPDSGIMSLSYDDKNKTTTFTQQDGSKVVYQRDDKFRTVGIVYEGVAGDVKTDGTLKSATGIDGAIKSKIQETRVFGDGNEVLSKTDKNGNRTSYEYDKLSRLTKEINPLGHITLIEYNNYNKPTKITHPDGGVVSLEHDNKGNVIGISDPLNQKTALSCNEVGLLEVVTLPDLSENKVEYDDKGNVTSITDSTGATTLYEYDGLNRAIKTTNGEGVSTAFEYDIMGNISKVTDAIGNCRTYECNISGKVTKITDFNGCVVEYKYNDIGKIDEVIDQGGGVTKLTYDLVWNVTSFTDPAGNTVNYEYDSMGRVVKVTDQEGNVYEYAYDNNGNVTAITSPLGATTKIKYDALDRQETIIEPDGAVTELTYDVGGNVTHIKDPLGNVTKREYDLAGQLTALTDSLGNKTTFTYSPLGKVETLTNPKGDTQAYTYYPGGQLKSVCLPCGESESYEYNKNGNMSKVTDALGNSTTLTYDHLDRVVIVTDSLGHSKHFEYDPIGNITKMTDANGNITQYRYSPLGDILEVIDPLGHSTKYDYDKMRRLTKLTQNRIIDDAISNIKHEEQQITTYQYNKKGEVISSTSPLGDIINYTYDPMGNLITKTDEDGLTTAYDYNISGKLAKIAYADGKTVELTYNSLKQLTQMKDHLGITSIEHDILGRVIKTTDHDNNEINYAYNALSQREKLTYPDGSEVNYAYNASGRLASVAHIPAGSEIPQVTSYIHDPKGQITQRILPDTTTTTYEYNPLGALASLTHSKDGDILDQFKYAYDPSGNITQIEKHRKGVDIDSGIFNYTYDPLNRLTEETRTYNNAHNNALGNAQGISRFMYDNLGNRIASIKGDVQTNYAYNARNQLIRTTEGTAATTPTINDYHYDNRGNLTQITENGLLKQSFTFDATGMMTQAFTQGKGMAEYTYNGFKKRVGKIENLNSLATATPTPQTPTARIQDPTGEVKYVLDMTWQYDNLLATKGTNQPTQSFIWGGSLLSVNESSQSLHYLNDHLGSPIRLLGNNGDIGDSDPFAYDVFGKQIATPSVVQPFGFTGYQTDAVSGMQYAQARYYDPAMARFVSEDILKGLVAEPLSLNQYNYALSNPLKFIDLDGLSPSRGNLRELLLMGELGIGLADALRVYAAAEYATYVANDFALRAGLYYIREDVIVRGGREHIEAVRVPDTWNNIADAYRHFVWNVEMVRTAGIDVAIAASNAHEINSKMNNRRVVGVYNPRDIRQVYPYIRLRMNRDTLMDLWNNRVGIELAARSDFAHKTYDELFLYALANNMLITNAYQVNERFGLHEDLFNYSNGWMAWAYWDITGFTMALWCRGFSVTVSNFGRPAYCE